MSEISNTEEVRPAPASTQSGMQVWVACLLFVAVPLVLILLIKYLLNI